MEDFLNTIHKFSGRSVIETALLIRYVENSLLDLFRSGLVSGTVHTSVGQEFSAITCTQHLQDGDVIFSNHRCHGHFIAHGGDVRALIGELLGKGIGVCGGVGGSQHLHKKDFYTNGIQGSIVPVAAGVALSKKLSGHDNVALVFIGDGTLGQGVVYETLNLSKLIGIPLVIVCENNGISQTTPHEMNFFGSIKSRINGFGVQYFSGTTQHPVELNVVAEKAISYSRQNNDIVFLEIFTNRLNAHSKGDDTRSPEIINKAIDQDLINNWLEYGKHNVIDINIKIKDEVDFIIREVLELPISNFRYSPGILDDIRESQKATKEEIVGFSGSVSNRINEFFHEYIENDGRRIFIGEDVLSPYGGAFKIASELSTKYPQRVISTPISEQSITGLSNGLALGGYKPYLEFMFGDFACLAADQIINSSAKFFHMYAEKVSCPVVFRMPMGGGRGYGPTHSQSIEKMFCGIENIAVVAVNRLMDPLYLYRCVDKIRHPIIIIENKKDYPKTYLNCQTEYDLVTGNSVFPEIVLKPINEITSTVVIATYGGSIELALEVAHQIFVEFEISPTVAVFTLISPIQLGGVLEVLKSATHLITIEEGNGKYGFGSELLSTVAECGLTINGMKMHSEPYPIPSHPDLENLYLVNFNENLSKIRSFLNDSI